jgi:hypothetical protein
MIPLRSTHSARRRRRGLARLAALLAAAWTAAAVAQLRPTATPRASTTTVTRGFLPDPVYVQFRAAGGPLSAQAVAGGACSGYISAEPTVVLNLRGVADWFRIFVDSRADTTLVVRGPDGQTLCNDNTFGRGPAVDGTFAPGRYTVWVGTAQPGASASGLLAFTELPDTRPQP